MGLMVADNPALFHEGVISLLMRQDHGIATEAASADEPVEAAARTAPDVAITNVCMPPGTPDDGLRAAVQIRESQPETGIMVLSQYATPTYAIEPFEPNAPIDGVGGLGYPLRDGVVRVAGLVRSLGVVEASGAIVDPEVTSSLIKGRPSQLNGLTARESGVLEFMAQELSNRQIHERMLLSTAVVSKHVANVFSKFGMLPGEENRRVRAVLVHLTGKRN